MTTKYLTNPNLANEIHKCKMTYCWYKEPEYEDYDCIVSSVDQLTEEILANDPIVRVMTYDHIPLDEQWPATKPKKKASDGYVKVNFPPFIHIKYTQGQGRIVLKSHHIDKETFSPDHGRMTDRLGRMYHLQIEKIAQKRNWRNYSFLDEMKSEALLVLMRVGLQFNEYRSQYVKDGVYVNGQLNPFAWSTSVIYNAFKAELKSEKKIRDFRDDILESKGQLPSITRQIEREVEAITRDLGRLNCNYE